MSAGVLVRGKDRKNRGRGQNALEGDPAPSVSGSERCALQSWEKEEAGWGQGTRIPCGLLSSLPITPTPGDTLSCFLDCYPIRPRPDEKVTTRGTDGPAPGRRAGFGAVSQGWFFISPSLSVSNPAALEETAVKEGSFSGDIYNLGLTAKPLARCLFYKTAVRTPGDAGPAAEPAPEQTRTLTSPRHSPGKARTC